MLEKIDIMIEAIAHNTVYALQDQMSKIAKTYNCIPEKDHKFCFLFDFFTYFSDGFKGEEYDIDSPLFIDFIVKDVTIGLETDDNGLLTNISLDIEVTEITTE